MNPTPELPAENGRAHLRRAVAALPAHAPDPATWPRIAGQLAAAQAIAAALPYLPTHAPAADTWAAIAARLDARNELAAAPMSEPAAAPAPVVRPLWPARLGWVAGLAAAVLLLLGVWGLWPTVPPTPFATAAPQETVSFSEEVAVLPPTAAGTLTAPVDPLAQEGEAFIEAHCTSLPTVCQSGEFQDLRAQLSEVEAQQRRLHQDLQRFGPSPALVREQGQLTTLRAMLTRELVQLIIS